jgi:hypothetical protein
VEDEEPESLTERIVEDNHGLVAGQRKEGEEGEGEEPPLGREETLSKDSAIDNRYDSDEVSPTGPYSSHRGHNPYPTPCLKGWGHEF